MNDDEVRTFRDLAHKVDHLEKSLKAHFIKVGYHLNDLREEQIRQGERIDRAYMIAWFAIGFAGTAIITAIMVVMHR